MTNLCQAPGIMDGVDPEEFPDETDPLASDGDREIAWEDDDYPAG